MIMFMFFVGRKITLFENVSKQYFHFIYEKIKSFRKDNLCGIR